MGRQGEFLCNKKLKILPSMQNFVVQRNDFRVLFDMIMIYTKQRKLLAAENSQIAVIGLSLK